jgi:hypothetical protein
MSEHFFNIDVAQFAGVPQALFIAHLKHWTINNIGNRKNFINGLYWSYYTYEALQVIFPYYSKRQLEGIIEKCLELGLITKGKYNKSKWDRTNWFALTDLAYKFYPDIEKAKEKISQLTISPKGEMEDPQKGKCSFPQTGKCTNTDNIIQIETTNTNANSGFVISEEFPENGSSPKLASSGFVISEEIDRELLIANRNQPMHAKDNREFLMWAKLALETKIKAETIADSIRILKSWIKGGGLRKPTAPTAPTAPTKVLASIPGKPIDDLKYRFQGYLMSIAGDKRLMLLPQDYQPMSFEDWVEHESPSRSDLNAVGFKS